MSDRMSFADLKEMLVHHGGVSPELITDNPDLNLEELGIGSMALLAIQLDLSQRFGVSVTEDDLPKLATLGGFLRFVNGH